MGGSDPVGGGAFFGVEKETEDELKEMQVERRHTGVETMRRWRDGVI